ncbi:MAG TPA: DUF3243 domain-containing protein [Clostridia bacterium]|nr:DUF3243 domain-containing protein [Clostridia bacterium]
MQISSWDEWLDTLRMALDRAEKMKMPKKIITKSAAELGDVLLENVDPEVPENMLLKKMWQVADDQERQSIANVMIKLVQKRPAH